MIIGGAARAEVVERPANVVADWSFESTRKYADPFNDVELDAIFTPPSGNELRVPAYWAGGQTWGVRYSSSEVGTHRFRTVCSDASNADLHGVERKIEITPYTGENQLLRHGPIRVAADKKHFEHADGSPFFWLGDTWWMGLTNRLHWPEEFASLTKDRVGKGFTVVQIVAGLYPDMPAFDARGANEFGFPWEKDYARINPDYFASADHRIEHLAANGIAPCIVGAWGYHLPWLGVEKMKKHWRNIIARWGAYPVFWCVAGEGAMPYYLAPDKAKDAEFQKRGWTEIASYIRKTDPFHRPISIHPTDLSRTNVTDPAVLDFEMLQTGHGDRASLPQTIDSLRRSRAATPTMPTINSEVCYEGILGTCHDDVVRLMAWTSFLAGTAGHTYGANGIWQLNRKDQPYGKSPHGGTYGPTPWDEAMNLPGSAQMGHAKKLLERFEWWKFEPHPEWARIDAGGEESVGWGDWIWYPEGNPTVDAPIAKRRFRKTIEIPPGGKIERAILHLTADNHFHAFVNGKEIGEDDGWESPWRFEIAAVLRPGKNVLAIEALNVWSDVRANPAGLICGGEVTLSDGTRVDVRSGAGWKSADTPATSSEWTHADYNDSTWPAAKVIAHYGDKPWGDFNARPGTLAPAAAGIDGQVRVIYVPQAQPIRVEHLQRDVRWRAEFFDPATGRSSAGADPVIDASGACRFDPPSTGHDWVLLLTRP